MDNRSSRTMFIVDDDFDTRRLVARYMKSCFQCKILEVSNGEDALTLLEEQKVNIILCDYEMPGISGVEVARELIDRELKITLLIYTSTELRTLNLYYRGATFKAISKPNLQILASHVSDLMGWAIAKRNGGAS